MKSTIGSIKRNNHKTNGNYHTPSDRTKYALKVLKARKNHGKGKLEASDIDSIAGLEIL